MDGFRWPFRRELAANVLKRVINMSLRILAFATAVAIMGLIPSVAQANTITINSTGIVGIIEGTIQGTDPANEELLAERLLAMGTNQTLQFASPALNCGSNQGPTCDYRTGNNDYLTADLTFINKDESQSPNVLPSLQGNVYILGKYDGQNAGYILFYLPDWNSDPSNTDNVLPVLPATIWGNGQDTGLALSHYSAFSFRNVPDGGATLALLGGALLGLGALRRKFNP
jgi:hypothetical protein